MERCPKFKIQNTAYIVLKRATAWFQGVFVNRLFLNHRKKRGQANKIMLQVKNGEIVDTFTERFLYLNMPSPESDYYGIPEYLPAYDDIQLLVAATNLRRTFYSKNGYLGGVLAMNVPVEDVNDEGNSKTEQNWANNVIEAVTKNGEKIWLFNLRGNPEIEDISKAIRFFSLAQTLKDYDFKSSVSAALQNILYVYRTDPDLIGAVREKEAWPTWKRSNRTTRIP